MEVIETSPEFSSYEILGVRVDEIDLDTLIETIKRSVVKQEKIVVANVNVHAIMIAQKNEWFSMFLKKAKVVFCDGFGVKWAAKILLGKSLHRLTYVDWFGDLARECAAANITIYFLGTKQEIGEKAAVVLVAKNPQLRIVGVHHGYFNKNNTGFENKKVVEEINLLHPNILLVGFGMPVQEKWISENLDSLNVNVVMPSGAYLDYLAGSVPRPPRWMTDHGLEWLGRLIIEPGRLWKRYLLEIPSFLILVVKEMFLQRHHKEK